MRGRAEEIHGGVLLEHGHGRGADEVPGVAVAQSSRVGECAEGGVARSVGSADPAPGRVQGLKTSAVVDEDMGGRGHLGLAGVHRDRHVPRGATL